MSLFFSISKYFLFIYPVSVIYTIDLLNGIRNGVFKKKDYRNNIITVFDENNVNKFLEMKLNVSSTTGIEVFDTLDEFFSSVYKEWYGLECYAEMIENGLKFALILNSSCLI